jgi:hypothetical protein
METQAPMTEKGPLYWFVHNSLKGFVALFQRHRLFVGCSVCLFFVCLFILRAFVHPLVIAARKHLAVIFLFALVLFVFYWQVRKPHLGRRVVVSLLGVIVIFALIYLGGPLHTYLALYYRYSTLSIVELNELPHTDHERIQPRNSIFSLAHEVMTESESPTSVDLARVGTEFRWTMAIEPAYPISRLFNGIKQLYTVSATAPAPNFSQERRIPVDFTVGEDLLLSRNTHIATIRNFGLWRFFNYQPSDVTYFTDQEGNWVQIVSLVRWRGLFFPRPEFGGVQLIRQEKEAGVLGYLRLLLFGTGEWISPETVASRPYLLGENILPYTVSRNIANSFRFQNGFWAPMPGYHNGDVRIPNMAADVSDQPFTEYFVFPGQEKGILYHYFALEPFDPEKQGLNTSLFIPADGTGPLYVYKHHLRTGVLTGVSAIAAKVMESKKFYDWNRNRPVEHRPYIREIGGKLRFFWLTTVVTFKEGEQKNRFIAGSVPDVVVTDAAYNNSVWVNPLDRESWPAQIEAELAAVWNAK